MYRIGVTFYREKTSRSSIFEVQRGSEQCRCEKTGSSSSSSTDDARIDDVGHRTASETIRRGTKFEDGTSTPERIISDLLFHVALERRRNLFLGVWRWTREIATNFLPWIQKSPITTRSIWPTCVIRSLLIRTGHRCIGYHHGSVGCPWSSRMSMRTSGRSRFNIRKKQKTDPSAQQNR